MRAFALRFSKIRSWLAAPVVALASFASAPAHGQVTCESPLEAGLGATEFATLLQFPSPSIALSCWGSSTMHHAVYLRFTAPQDGWCSMHAAPEQGSSWFPQMAVLESCNGSVVDVVHSGWTRPWCSTGDPSESYVSYCTVRMQQGESRIVIVGSSGTAEAGSGKLMISRIGTTLMDGAQALNLGTNAFSVQALAPYLPYGGMCPNYGMRWASRFTFVPPKSGSYVFNFCGSDRSSIAISDSPELTYSSLIEGNYGCSGAGSKLVAQLDAGTTYYVVAGTSSNWQSCTTHNATVEYIDPCPADLNNDDETDGKDLATIISGWDSPEADISGDGTTDGIDLGILLAYWGPCPK